MNYTVKERDSYVKNIYDQHGNLLERRTTEWEFSPCILREDLTVAHVSPDHSQVYILPLLDKGVVNLAETYRRIKYERGKA